MKYREAIYKNLKRNDPEKFSEMTYEDFSRDCFYYPNGDQKRLRQHGYILLREYFKSYEVKWPENINPEKLPTKHILWLTNRCKDLYYVGRDKIVFFNSEDALVFKLCDADLESIQKVS